MHMIYFSRNQDMSRQFFQIVKWILSVAEVTVYLPRDVNWITETSLGSLLPCFYSC